jgi:feruloyl esterase
MLAAVIAAVAACATSPTTQAQAFADSANSLAGYAAAATRPGKRCEALAGFRSRVLREIHAAPVAGVDDVAAHCRVTGFIDPEIAFEVSLPDAWNGRFYMIGNGGHAGESLEDPGRVAQRDAALRLGFAFAQTNTGHDARKEPGASFVLSDPRKAIDYAYRAVNQTAVLAKAVTREYYGKPVDRAYWNSCSNGGRQGLIEAQRFPEDFDGILANAPWVDQTGFTIGALWNQRALAAAPLSAAKVATVAAAVMAKCDAVDGLQDGLIDDPRACRFDARVDVPACAAGADGPECLTAPQAEAVMKIHRGPVGKGKPLFPGFMPGSESAWMGLVVPPTPAAKPADFNLAEGTMRYLVHVPPRPEWDYRTFDFDRDVGLLRAWGKKANADNADLSRFRRKGGKLIMTYGWADSILQPLMGVRYYEKVAARNGSRTSEFLRLYMVPGMTHCAGGVGTDRFDAMTALIDWVEKGKAPESLRASRVVENREVRSRPLCPYPQVARHTGQGSIDEAASFRCVAP